MAIPLGVRCDEEPVMGRGRDNFLGFVAGNETKFREWEVSGLVSAVGGDGIIVGRVVRVSEKSR